MKRFGVALLAAASMSGASAPAASSAAPVAVESRDTYKLIGDVRNAINRLPYYGVFDSLSYSIDNAGVVTLYGATRTYVVHNSAVAAVTNIPGVTRVEDKIEVLPLSPFDDDIRARAYNAIFAYPALNRYAWNPQPSIRIIVNRGNVTVAGVVANEFDRNLIEMRLRSVGGTFSVKNELRLDSDTDREL